ncbi:exodeoxyribonuclease III [Candidatus Marithrix sp. Canyon 246]|uniref:exodeoxyribonuclease III n=1 Tax=Candidatus Marithrix sp. Canyon 246 TaxID=1827136 RepID=UPI00084A17E7|nr:exodeoxyribonuclease III [Candidatus Marithrix sp. Canyon 246]
MSDTSLKFQKNVTQLKIATWNVNSIRVRLQHLLDWLEKFEPDIIALQETKVIDEQFPLAAIEAAGYHAVFAGQKSYNGVALLSRLPAQDVIRDIPNLEDSQRRIIAATFGKLRILNLYVPNGANLESDKYQYKLDWLAKVHDYISDNIKKSPELIVLGDFNIAPEDADVYDPKAWQGKILVSPAERAALQALEDLGLDDTFRLFEQQTDSFSWWDYRMGAFVRNRGVRIDLILASKLLSNKCQSCNIDTKPRSLERPSDHAPIIACFDII